MDPISGSDRLAIILRQKLLDQAKAGRKAAGDANPPTNKPRFETVKALSNIDGVDEHQVNRTLIQSILADSFGSELLNEAKFQQVVDRVTATLEDDPDGAGLLAKAKQLLRVSPGQPKR